MNRSSTVAANVPAFLLGLPVAPSITNGLKQRQNRCKLSGYRQTVRAVASGEAKTELITDGVSNGMTLADTSQSAIRSMDDVEEIINMVEEFDLYDFRLESHGVTIELSREGGRGFQDGKLGAVPQANQEVVEEIEEEEEEEVEEETIDVEPEAVMEEEEKVKVEEEKAYEDDFVVKSDRVGLFYSGAKNKPPLVNVGDHVDFNQPVCIIEQLGQQYVYLSEASGSVQQVFVEDGDAVEYGQDVMVIRPD